MGSSLSLTVIAEGAETKEQADFLAGQACDELHGYYFSVPVPADNFTARLKIQSMPGLARAESHARRLNPRSGAPPAREARLTGCSAGTSRVAHRRLNEIS